MDKIRARKIARDIARRMEIEDGDMLVLKKGLNITEDIRLFNSVRRALGAIGKERVVVCVVDDFDDIRVLDEREMAGYGWCRCGAGSGEEG